MVRALNLKFADLSTYQELVNDALIEAVGKAKYENYQTKKAAISDTTGGADGSSKAAPESR